MRERINLLIAQFEKKDNVTSAVEPPQPSEKDQLLEQIKELKLSFKNRKIARNNGKKSGKREAAAVGAVNRDTAAMQHWIQLNSQPTLANGGSSQGTSKTATPTASQVLYLEKQLDDKLKPDDAPFVADMATLTPVPNKVIAPSPGAEEIVSPTIDKEVPQSDVIFDVVVDSVDESGMLPTTISAESPINQQPPSPSPTRQGTSCAAPPAIPAPAEEPLSSAGAEPTTPSNDDGGPIRRRRAGITRSITEYMRAKRVTERDVKMKALEVEFLKEQNESRRIAVLEQQMSAVISCLTQSTEVLKQILVERK